MIILYYNIIKIKKKSLHYFTKVFGCLYQLFECVQLRTALTYAPCYFLQNDVGIWTQKYNLAPYIT